MGEMGPGLYTLLIGHWMLVTPERGHNLGQGDSLQLKWSPKETESRELSASITPGSLIPKERLWSQPPMGLNPVSAAP